MQLALLNFFHDIFSDKMRKHVSQADALGCQGNISENGVRYALWESMLKYLHRGKYHI